MFLKKRRSQIFEHRNLMLPSLMAKFRADVFGGIIILVVGNDDKTTKQPFYPEERSAPCLPLRILVQKDKS